MADHLNAQQARDELLRVRGSFDKTAKAIIDTLNNVDAEVEERAELMVTSALDAKQAEFTEKVVPVYEALEKVEAAFDQWEITEPCPLNEDDSFMFALRDLLRSEKLDAE